MHFMGFGSKWISFIRACLYSSSISILINGSPTKEFVPERGIRQGDPISPFLFIIVAEGLNILVKRALSNGHLQGLKIGHDNLVITHLQYADDTIFFGEWNKRNAKYISKLLKCFENISGLKVNFRKSKLYGIGTSTTETEQMARYINCSAGSTPFTYLGLPIGVPTSHASSWQPIVEKFDKRLSDWAAKSISFGGRLTIIKSILSSIPLYYFSLFHTPAAILKIILPYENGGLNVGSLFAKNISLLCKGWWRFKNEHNALWVAPFGKRSSKPKKSRTNQELSSHLRFQSASAMAHRLVSGMTCGSDLKPSKPFSIDYTYRPDSWKFSLDASGLFTTSSLSNLINTLKYGIHSQNISLPRNKFVPQKVFIFTWRVIQLKIPVRSELDKKGIDLHSILCPLCYHHIETIEHALINCPKVSPIWAQMLDWWNQNNTSIYDINGAIISDQGFQHNSIGSSLWQATKWIACSIIWKHRNLKVFSNKIWNPAMLISEIQTQSFSWISNRSRKKIPIEWHQWLLNPSFYVAPPSNRMGVG
ncbi:uncharacterized protein [Rutidosis leptorrhynchoides]|uniref:uncharacterized protein n=1 Tax=Rutidosis leptorrhynchoides TaxID=125765 RepID=UPI003A99B04A